jgi:hypothetical protein
MKTENQKSVAEFINNSESIMANVDFNTFGKEEKLQFHLPESDDILNSLRKMHNDLMVAEFNKRNK